MPSSTGIRIGRPWFRSAASSRTDPAYSPCGTTASAWNRNTGTRSLDCLKGCTRMTNTRGRASGWRSVSGLLNGITEGSGSNQLPGKDPHSDSQYRSDPPKGPKRYHILVVEDNRADVFLIRESIAAARLDAD